MSVHGQRIRNRPDSVLLAAVLLLAGMYILLWFERLPTTNLLLAAGTAVALALACRRRVFALLPLGLVLVTIDAQSVIEQRLDPLQAGKDIELIARIADFPQSRAGVLRLLVVPLNAGGLPSHIRLSWLDVADSPQMGECWQLTVRLRRPRGFSNPGGFDYEGWLFRQRIGATGYVRAGSRLDTCSHATGPRSWRASLAGRMTDLLPADDARAVLLAVTVGARHDISTAQWQRYAVTGTSHLMAISGMHVGLAAGACYLVCLAALGCTRGRGNHRVVAAAIALLFATAYASLSGFAVPARRAWTMLALATIAIISRRQAAPGHFFAGVVLVVAATAPLDVLSPGFQLSFAAVAILIVLALRRPVLRGRSLPARGMHAIASLTALQLALLLGLFPLTATWFARTAWLAPGVNLVVLPVFNLVSVPAALLGLLLDGPFAAAGDSLLWLAWRSLGLVLRVIDTAAGVPRSGLPLPALNMSWLLLACLPVFVDTVAPRMARSPPGLGCVCGHLVTRACAAASRLCRYSYPRCRPGAGQCRGEQITGPGVRYRPSIPIGHGYGKTGHFAVSAQPRRSPR